MSWPIHHITIMPLVRNQYHEHNNWNIKKNDGNYQWHRYIYSFLLRNLYFIWCLHTYAEIIYCFQSSWRKRKGHQARSSDINDHLGLTNCDQRETKIQAKVSSAVRVNQSALERNSNHFVQMMTKRCCESMQIFFPLPFLPFSSFQSLCWFPLVFCGFISTALGCDNIRLAPPTAVCNYACISHPLERHLNLWAAALASSGD